GQQHADPRLQPDAAREHPARGAGRADRHARARRPRMTNEVPQNEVIDTAKGEMESTILAFKKDLSHVRTGRATTQLLYGLFVEYYGAKPPLNQVAQVNAPEATLLVIQPYDKAALTAIERAIHTSDLGLNPQNDGKIIRVPVPPLTEERRREMVKHLHKILEDHRTAIRNVRRDGNEAIKKAMKDKKISEDEEKKALDEVQKLTDAEIKKMEEMSAAKEKELMTV